MRFKNEWLPKNFIKTDKKIYESFNFYGKCFNKSPQKRNFLSKSYIDLLNHKVSQYKYRNLIF